MQREIAIIDRSEPVACLMQPGRMAILEVLRKPGTAASVARIIGQPRQKVTYHVRALEKHGLLQHREDRRKGNCVERVVQASAQHYLIAPGLLAGLSAGRADLADRFSSAYQIAVASRIAERVVRLRMAAEAAALKLATLTLETQISFASPAAQADFATALQLAIQTLTAQYHCGDAANSRSFQLTVLMHPLVKETDHDV